MKLTAQVIASAPIVVNPDTQLTLQLRGLQIPYIENLELTEDRFAVLDLTNNELSEVDNIPPLHNLEVLLLAGNNIRSISNDAPETLLENLPRLRSLSLMNNQVKVFSNLKALAHLKLSDLVLTGNDVTTLANYRLLIIWMIPSLQVLDFERVKSSERLAAVELFGPVDAPNELCQSLLSGGQYTEEVRKSLLDELTLPKYKRLSDEDKVSLLLQLETAESVDEIERIEKLLKA